MPLDNMAPGMGVTYADLARLRKPELVGQSLRPGLSAGAAGAYGRDQQAFQGYLDQMAPLAEQDAQMKQQAGQEWIQGTEGRRLGRERSMAEDKAKLEEARDPRVIEAKIAEKVAKLHESKRKIIESKMHIYADLATSDPQDIPMKLEQYGEEASFNGKPLQGKSPEQILTLTRGIVQGLKTTQKYLQTMDKQTSQNESYQRVAREKAASAERIAANKAKVDKAIAELKALSAEKRASIPKGGTDSLLSRMISDLMEGGLSLTEALEEAQPLISEIKSIRRESKPDFGAILRGETGTPTPPTKKPEAKTTENSLAAKAKKAFGSYDPKKYDYREYNGEIQRKAK